MPVSPFCRLVEAIALANLLFGLVWFHSLLNKPESGKEEKKNIGQKYKNKAKRSQRQH